MPQTTTRDSLESYQALTELVVKFNTPANEKKIPLFNERLETETNDITEVLQSSASETGEFNFIVPSLPAGLDTGTIYNIADTVFNDVERITVRRYFPEDH